MELFNNERTQKIILFIFLVLQPFMDCYLLYSDKIISIFNFSPTTIFRLVFVACFCLIIFCGKTSKKNKIIIGIYALVVALYSTLHIWYDHCLNITNYSAFNLSIINEMLYIIRMLLPFGIAFLAYSIKFTKKEFAKIIYIVLGILSMILIISNIFKISLSSYSSGIIKANIFSWFNNTMYSPVDMASKGWFNSANQISGLFMLLMPIAIAFLLDEYKFSKALIIWLGSISMMILGTRTSSYGWALNIIFVTIAYIFISLLNKNRINFKSVFLLAIICVVSGGILRYAPIVSSAFDENIYDGYVKAEQIIKDSNSSHAPSKNESNPIGGDSPSGKNDDISELVTKLTIKSDYYSTIYPVEEHEDFWKSYLFEIPLSEKYGQRNIQKLITFDIDKHQHTKATPFFGYGYTRFTNVALYLEHDIFVHYYTIGIFGIVIFLLPYLIISIICIFSELVKKRRNFTNIIIATAVLEVFLLSIITGHILDELIVSLYMGFAVGYLLKRMEIKDETKD